MRGVQRFKGEGSQNKLSLHKLYAEANLWSEQNMGKMFSVLWTIGFRSTSSAFQFENMFYHKSIHSNSIVARVDNLHADSSKGLGEFQIKDPLVILKLSIVVEQVNKRRILTESPTSVLNPSTLLLVFVLNNKFYYTILKLKIRIPKQRTTLVLDTKNIVPKRPSPIEI